MPSDNRPVTEEDLRAPEGQYRIIREDANGEMTIVGDIRNFDFAVKIAIHLSEKDRDSKFTLLDYEGHEIFYG